MYWEAACAATAPSEQAVITWRKGETRTSPAAKMPGTLVAILSSVTIEPDSSLATWGTLAVFGSDPTKTKTASKASSRFSPETASARTTDSTLLAAADLDRHRVEQHLDVRILQHAGGEGLLGPETVPAVDHHDLARELGEVHRLVAGSVAAADHEDPLALEEGAVAGGAVGDAPAGERILAGDAQVPVLGARGHDHRLGGEPIPARLHDEARTLFFNAFHRRRDELGAETLGLDPHAFGQVIARDGLQDAGIILELVDEESLPSSGHLLDHDRLEIGAGAVLGGSQTGRPCPDDQKLAAVFHREKLLAVIIFMPGGMTSRIVSCRPPPVVRYARRAASPAPRRSRFRCRPAPALPPARRRRCRKRSAPRGRAAPPRK